MEWQRLEMASESTKVSLAKEETALRAQTHLRKGAMAWACARTLVETARPMEPPAQTSVPRCTYVRSG